MSSQFYRDAYDPAPAYTAASNLPAYTVIYSPPPYTPTPSTPSIPYIIVIPPDETRLLSPRAQAHLRLLLSSDGEEDATVDPLESMLFYARILFVLLLAVCSTSAFMRPWSKHGPFWALLCWIPLLMVFAFMLGCLFRMND
jgi:hypothetical protein